MDRKLGTFLGVYTPTVLTILGVIMYLRFGWLVGQLGLQRVLLIVLLANAITIITTLSFSAVATNTHLGAGGAYYIISRSLGIEIGGAIGLPLFLSQASSVTLYCYGLAESLRFVWAGVPLQLATLALVLIVGVIAYLGAEQALKSQIPLMFLVGISLAALATGALTRPAVHALATGPAIGTLRFWPGFAIFFPAVLVIYWLLRTLLNSLFLVIVIVFQRDIRRALTQVGKTPFYRIYDDTDHSLNEIIAATQYLARRRIGALIVIERDTGLRDYLESGHTVDAKLTKELLISLFLPTSPLHDGGVVISNNRIQTAGCLLPLSKNPYIDKRYGTRHRAAIGLSEETDAVIIVISEETQEISLVRQGTITKLEDEKHLTNELEAIFVSKDIQPLLWKNWFSRF